MDGKSAELPDLKEVATAPLQRRLEGQVCIITGANSALGIGRAAAHQFARNGARALFVCDFKDDNLGAIRQEIKGKYPVVEVHVRSFDAASEDAVKQVVEDVLRLHGRLDVFFANAGVVGAMRSFTDVSASEMMETLRINVLGSGTEMILLGNPH